ncbi:MAG TPA: hypothetical protein VK277_02095 [Acidimicrobiales bacterium]|nr:hypothetical protein [Acidimicrobiales bacterium]
MSEHPTQPGDWLASDGRWYPAELHPSYQPPPPTPVAPAGPPPPTAPVVPGGPPPTPGATEAPTPRRHGLLPILLAGGALVIAVAAGIAVLVQRHAPVKVPTTPGSTTTGPTATTSSTSTTGSTVTTSSTSTTAAGGIPSSEPLLHGGDIGQTRSYVVQSQPVQITLLAVVYPVQAVNGQPITTSPSDQPPYVALELEVHNTSANPVVFETGADKNLTMTVTVGFGSNRYIGIDPNSPPPWGSLFALGTPLPAGGTRTGWFLVATGDVTGLPPMPGPPTGVEVAENAANAPAGVTWSLP